MWKKKVKGGDMLRKGHVGSRAKGMGGRDDGRKKKGS
jgi:hypothetical protein